MKKNMFLGYYGANASVVQSVEVDVDEHDVLSVRMGGKYLCTGKKNTVEEKDGVLFVLADSEEIARSLLLERMKDERETLLNKARAIEEAILGLH